MTKQELFEKVLQKLQVTAAGEDSQPEDIQLLESRYSSLHALLNGEGLAMWAVSGDIPDMVEIPFVAMLAAHSALEFGVPPQTYQFLREEGGIALTPQLSLAERQFRRLMARKYVPTRQTSEYF